MTARTSPRCPSSGYIAIHDAPGTILNCGGCGRPVRLMRSKTEGCGRIPPHGSVRTRMTDHHDDLLRSQQDRERYPHWLQPSHAYDCEHPDCDTGHRLTFKAESGRYCLDHFPWEAGERESIEGVVDEAV